MLCVVAGAVRRLQAPVIVGCVALLVLAVNALAPAAAHVPRWIPLGVAGVALLWLGATFERRLGQVRAFTTSVGEHLR